MRTELLEPTEVASSQTPLMSVRYSTVENPSTVRKSVVPVLRESQNQDVGIMTGDVDFAAVESPSNPSPERTRQRKNDSVSHGQRTERVGCTYGFLISSDEDGNLGISQVENTG